MRIALSSLSAFLAVIFVMLMGWYSLSLKVDDNAFAFKKMTDTVLNSKCRSSEDMLQAIQKLSEQTKIIGNSVAAAVAHRREEHTGGNNNNNDNQQNGWNFPADGPVPKISITSEMEGWHAPLGPAMRKCPDLKCNVVEARFGRSDFEDSDATFIMGIDMSDDRVGGLYRQFGKKKNGRYFIITGEPDTKFPAQKNALIDGRVSADLENDVPMFAIHWVPENYDFTYIQLNKRTDAIAAFFVTNCNGRNDRNKWYEALMQRFSIHSYGKCFHNKDWDGPDPGNGVERIYLMGTYKFCLTFENSNEKGYVTEKVFMSLASGCVPIYMGWDGVDDYLPAPNSIIKTSKFEGPAQLGDYLQHLLDHPEEYNEYLKWKTEEKPVARLKRLYGMSELNWGCRLCHHLSRRQGNHVRQRSLLFDLNTGECVVPKSNDGPRNKGTIELWIKSSLKSTQSLISSGKVTCDGWIFSIIKGSALGFCGGNNWFQSADMEDLTDDKWHHVAVTFEPSGQISLYKDGLLLNQGQINGFEGKVAPIALGVEGSEGPNRDKVPYHGNMDEIRIWNVVRSHDEIKNNFDRRFHGNEAPGLFAYFRPSFDGMSTRSFLWDFAGSHVGTHDAACKNMEFSKDTPVLKIPTPLVSI